jgi:1-acyl-sn-glycerol-3-phosphate acyltransferase
VENPTDLKTLKKNHSVFLYVGLHKSLWETTGILSCIHFQGLPIPYIGMGDNLLRGKFYQKLTEKAGVFLVKRAKTRKEIIESSTKLKQYITYYLAHGIDVAIFPEGTRRNIPESGKHGQFFATAFDAVLEYERNKQEILSQYKTLKAHNTFIIPFNIDYTRIREDYELARESAAKPRTLHVFDSLKMVKHIGDLYISFGEPIRVCDNLGKTRKELAVFTREKCLQLVKILPINIVSRAILDSYEAGKIKTGKIMENISANLKKLRHLKERFRGFSWDISPQLILEKVASQEINFRNIDARKLSFYKLYASYISHYLETG